MAKNTRVNTAKWKEDQKRWVIAVQRDGTRRFFYSSTPGKKGQNEANNKADRWLLNGEKDPERKRVEEAFCEYCLYRAGIVATKRGEPVPTSVDGLTRHNYGTYQSGLSYVNNWIVQGNEKKYVSSIDDAVIQSALDKAAAMGRSRKTIQRIRSEASMWLKFCRRRGYTNNRLEDVDIPKDARLKGKKILQPDALKKLFASERTVYCGKECFDRFIYAYRFHVLMGLRPGELVGIKWEDIEGDVLHVRRSINSDKDITQGKNENSIRDIYLFPLAKMQLEKQKEISGSKNEMVFGAVSQAEYANSWRRYTKHNGIPYVTPYELRHTFVSIIQTLPEATVKQLVGHSKAMDTGIYTHQVDGYEKATKESLERIFSDLI